MSHLFIHILERFIDQILNQSSNLYHIPLISFILGKITNLRDLNFIIFI